MSDTRTPCPHRRGEHNDDYRHCLDCGQEWVRIGPDWFMVEAWVRVHTSRLDGENGGVS